MSNEEFIYDPFVKSRVSGTLGITLLFHFSNILYNLSLNQITCPLYLKNSLSIPLGNIF